MIFSLVISFEINTLSIFYGFFFFQYRKKNEMRRFLRRNEMRAAYWKQTCFFFSLICDPLQQNRAVVCYQEKCDIPFIWKTILLTQRWYHSCVNWMQHCNFMVKISLNFFLFSLFFPHTNGVISWNAIYRQLPCFDVMGHISWML